MPESAALNPPPDARPWRSAGALIALVTAARILYLIFLSPYELSADEAQYWDWSRHLELSYHTKGSGVAWTIAAFTRVLGNSEWAVRTPAVLAWAVMAWALSRISRDVGGPRAALMSVLVTLAIPAYSATALLMTIDGPMLACWALAALCAWRLATVSMTPARIAFWAAALGASVGVGFLFKYTIALLLLGLPAFGWIARPVANARIRVPQASRPRDACADHPASAPSTWLVPCVTLAAFALCISPVIIWNQQHHWPTVAHLLGHAALPGSDLPGDNPSRLSPAAIPLSILSYAAVQLAVVGPIAVAFVLSVGRSLRRRGDDPQLALAGALALCGAAPVLLFYFAVACRTNVEGNWPIGAYVTLVPVAAAWATRELDAWRRSVTQWSALPSDSRPKQGFLRRRPETIPQLAVHWGVGYGVVGALGMLMLVPLSRLPLVGGAVPIRRLTGGHELAAEADRLRAQLRAQTGSEPLVIGARYTITALLAYYLPDHPTVHCAGLYLGERRTSYDDFASTDLRSPTLLGRPAVLVARASPRVAGEQPWARGLSFSSLSPAAEVSGYQLVTATGYAGPSSPIPRVSKTGD